MAVPKGIKSLVDLAHEHGISWRDEILRRQEEELIFGFLNQRPEEKKTKFISKIEPTPQDAADALTQQQILELPEQPWWASERGLRLSRVVRQAIKEATGETSTILERHWSIRRTCNHEDLPRIDVDVPGLVSMRLVETQDNDQSCPDYHVVESNYVPVPITPAKVMIGTAASPIKAGQLVTISPAEEISFVPMATGGIDARELRESPQAEPPKPVAAYARTPRPGRKISIPKQP